VRLPQAPLTSGACGTNVGFGIRVYVKTPRLRRLLALSMAAACAGAMVIVNTVIYVRDCLGGTVSDTALALPRLLARWPDRSLMRAGGAVLTAGLVLGLTAPGLLALLAVWFILGAGSSLIQTPIGRLLRRSAHDGDRPAIYAAQFALSDLCWLVAYSLAGTLGVTLSVTAAFAILAAVALASTLVALTLSPAHDPGELDHLHTAMEHQHLHIHDEHHQHHHEGWEGPEPHRHPHWHGALKHKYAYMIDLLHPKWLAA